MPILTRLFQYSFGGPRHSKYRRKRNKRNTNWKKRSKTHCLYMTCYYTSVHFNSVTQSCLTVCIPMDYSTPGFPVHQQLMGPLQIQVHCAGDAIHLSHPLSSPSPPAFNLSQHQGLFQRVRSSHQVAKVLEFQLQHQSFQ